MCTLLIVSSFSLQAQKPWNLEQCIDYALANNIQLKQSELRQRSLANNYEQSKRDRLPYVGANLSQNNSFGRSQVAQGTYENVNVNSASGNIGASISLFEGFTKQNRIKQHYYNALVGQEEHAVMSNNISIQIAQYYLQILLDQELVAVAKEQLVLSAKQIEDIKVSIEAGKLASSTLSEAISKQAQEEVQVVERENSLSLSYLKLVQLLYLDEREGFEIERPPLPELTAKANIENVADIYAKSLRFMPEIKRAQHEMKSLDAGIKVSKGSLYPSVKLQGSYGSSWYYNDLTGATAPFSKQLDNNMGSSIGLSISIPIFNALSVRTQVKNSQIQYKLAEYKLEDEKEKLKQEVEEAYLEALSALKRFEATEKSVLAAKEAFENIELKFQHGAATMTEVNESQNNYTLERSKSLQSKYNFIFKTLILQFYEGKALSL